MLHKQHTLSIHFHFHGLGVKSVQLGRLLKSSIFVVQKAAAPKNVVVFCQNSIGAFRCSLATLYDDGRHRTTKSLCGGWLWWVVVVVAIYFLFQGV